MMVVRDELDWNRVKEADPFKGEGHAFLYKDEKGKPAGYLVFEKKIGEKDRRILNCREAAFDSFATLKALMAFLKTFAADYEGACLQAPFSLNLGYFCADYPQSGTARKVTMNGMARAVHVEEVLRLAKYQGSGSIGLYVHDDFLPKNNGLYHIAFEDGKAKEVKFTSLPPAPFGKTGKKADVEITVNIFSGAILGNYDVADFAYMEGVALHCDEKKVSQVFYKKPCWINNYF